MEPSIKRNILQDPARAHPKIFCRTSLALPHGIASLLLSLSLSSHFLSRPHVGVKEAAGLHRLRWGPSGWRLQGQQGTAGPTSEADRARQWRGRGQGHSKVDDEGCDGATRCRSTHHITAMRKMFACICEPSSSSQHLRILLLVSHPRAPGVHNWVVMMVPII